MTILVSDILNQIRHAVGAGGLSEEISEVDILNEAGTYLCSMHAWNWLDEASATLDLVAGQDYCTLPLGIREVISIALTGSITDGFRWVTLAELDQIRNGQPVDWKYAGVIEWVQPAAGGEAIPRLAISPAPTASAAGAFTIRFKSDWVDVGRDSDPDTTALVIPKWLRPLLVRLARIFVKAWEEEEEGSIEQRLEGLDASRFLDVLKERDGAMQPELGQLTGGAAQYIGYVINWDSGEGVAAPS